MLEAAGLGKASRLRVEGECFPVAGEAARVAISRQRPEAVAEADFRFRGAKRLLRTA